MTSEPAVLTLVATAAFVVSTTETAATALMVVLNLKTTVCPALALMMRGSTVVAPLMGTILSMGRSKSPATPWVFRETTAMSVSGGVGVGITAAVADAMLVPMALLAVTEQPYRVRLSRLLTMTGEWIAVPVSAPGLQIAV